MGKKHVFISFHHDEPEGYEGSHHDMMQDYARAGQKGITKEQYENSAEDRIQDKAGEKHVKDKTTAKAAIHNETSYSPGRGAFKSPPKQSHGYGHKAAQRQGHLRMSGHAGAHSFGKKK